MAEELRAAGWTVLPMVAPERAPRAWPDVVEHLLSQLPTEREVVLVPHSNAGLYVPARRARRARRRVVGAVFVDAGLPPPAGSVALAPAPLLAHLTTLAGPDGRLPVWSEWWSPADVAGLFGSAGPPRDVLAEQAQLPLDYFRDVMPVFPRLGQRPARGVPGVRRDVCGRARRRRHARLAHPHRGRAAPAHAGRPSGSGLSPG